MFSVNADRYTEFVLNRRTHKIKIGKPTRELWIDGDWHECYFNNKLRVRIDGTYHQATTQCLNIPVVHHIVSIF